MKTILAFAAVVALPLEHLPIFKTLRVTIMVQRANSVAVSRTSSSLRLSSSRPLTKSTKRKVIPRGLGMAFGRERDAQRLAIWPGLLRS